MTYVLLATGAIFILIGVLYVLKVGIRDELAVGGMLGVFVGMVFIFAGWCAFFAETVLEFDQRRGKATFAGMLSGNKEDTVLSLSALDGVTIKKEVRTVPRQGTDIYFPVLIHHAGGDIEISATLIYQEARKEAEAIARFLGVRLTDTAEDGAVTVREFHELDRSIRDQARANREKVILPPRPDACRVRQEPRLGGLALEVPRCADSWLGPLMLMLVSLLPAAVVGAYFYSEYDKMAEAAWAKNLQLAIGCLMASPLVIVPLARFVWVTNSERIIATPEKLEVKRGYSWLPWTSSMQSEEIEEFELRRDNDAKGLDAFLGWETGIVARGDKQTLDFARGLSQPEKEWVHAVLKQILTH